MKFIIFIAIFICLTQALPIEIFSNELDEIEDGIERRVFMEVGKATARTSCSKPYQCQPLGYCQQYHSKQPGYCVKKSPAKSFCTMNMQCLSNNCDWFKCS